VAPEALAEAMQRRLQQGARIVAVGGGDGTISTAAGVLAGKDVVLLPLPLGTRNHFAQRYGLASLAAAALALRQGTVTLVPLGAVNGHHFLNNASCGFYARMVQRRDRLRRWLGSWPASFVSALLLLWQRPLLELQIAAGGSQLERRVVALWVGIGRHSLRLPEPGDADKEGALLEVVMPRPLSRLALLRMALRVWQRLRGQGKPIDPQLETLRAHAFTLHSRGGLDVALDGELHQWAGPLHFRYQADGLRVLCLVTPERFDQGTS
jgi:diacylglycerol kinase family enzyme